jgi:hypothetical protein
MTIEEAHIKATLQYGDFYKNPHYDDSRIFVRIDTMTGEDPTPSYEIIVAGEWEGGDWTVGSGDSWEAAFADADQTFAIDMQTRLADEAKAKERDRARKAQDHQHKLDKRAVRNAMLGHR